VFSEALVIELIETGSAGHANVIKKTKENQVD